MSLQRTLPDGILVRRTLDTSIAKTPEALRYELQAGGQMLYLGWISAGQLNSMGGFLQDVQDSLEDSPRCGFSEKRIKLLQTRGEKNLISECPIQNTAYTYFCGEVGQTCLFSLLNSQRKIKQRHTRSA